MIRDDPFSRENIKASKLQNWIKVEHETEINKGDKHFFPVMHKQVEMWRTMFK